MRALQSARTAHDGNTFPDTRGGAAGLGRVLGIEIHVVGDEEIEAAVAIVIDKAAAGGPTDVIVPESGFARDVGEGAVAVVVEENVVSPEGDEEIDEAVVVVVAGADSLAPAGERDFCLLGYIRKCPVVVVAVEMAGRLLSFRPHRANAGRARGPGLWEAFEAAAVDEEDVGPAIVVEVEGGNAAARGLDDVPLGLIASVFGFGGHAGLGSDIDEVDLRGRRQGCHRCGMLRTREYCEPAHRNNNRGQAAIHESASGGEFFSREAPIKCWPEA